jgi:hypothetical protein
MLLLMQVLPGADVGNERVRQAKFIAGVRAQGVMGHQL